MSADSAPRLRRPDRQGELSLVEDRKGQPEGHAGIEKLQAETRDLRQSLVGLVSAAVEITGVGVEIANQTGSFSHLPAVCRNCAVESPAIYQRCGETVRRNLPAGASRFCDRGHKLVGREGGVLVILPKTVAGHVATTRSVSQGQPGLLSTFLDRLRTTVSIFPAETRQDRAAGVARPGMDRPAGVARAGTDRPAGVARAGTDRPAMDATVRCLLSALDAKDSYTRGHSERVQIICGLLGKEMGLDRDTMDDLYWASLLHDVGKIASPDRILKKRGKLTAKEYAVMKEHPGCGDEMLAPLEWLGRARLGVRHHHERMDGEGYPDGIGGEEIPQLGRIIAVADTFDAVISRRHYRYERSEYKALAILKEAAGTQLDTRIVDAFHGCFERVNEALATARVPAEGLGMDQVERAA